MKFFKRIPTLTRINDAIYDLERNLLINQHNLDHFQALVNSNLAALKRLKGMRDSGIDTPAVKVPVEKTEKIDPVLKTKLRSAA